MNRIKVSSIVDVYEVESKDVPFRDVRPSIIITSHWNISERVNIVIDPGDGTVGHQYTVIASDLEAAIKNARNAR